MIVRGKVEGGEPRQAFAVGAVSAAIAKLQGEVAAGAAAEPDIRFTGPSLVTKPAAVSLDTLEAFVGRSAFLRISRRDGRSEIVAGRITEVSAERITMAAFDVAAAQALAVPGDDFYIHVSSTTAEPAIILSPGDTVAAAVALPVALGGKARCGARRIDLRTRAQELLDGKERDGLTPDTIGMHVVRDAEGTPYLSPANRPVLEASAAADLKAEQNAIVMALAAPLTRMFYDAARLVGVGDAAESHRAIRVLFENLTSLAGQITVRFVKELPPESPLGRAFKRLATVHKLAQSHLPQVVVSETPTGLLKQGMVTPVAILTRLTEVAEHFAASSGLAASQIIRNSPTIVIKLAVTHQRVLESVDSDLSLDDGTWSPSHFQLIDGRLELTSAFLEQLATTRGIRFDALPARTTGCPAAQTFNGTNPVREFVALFADLVAQVGR